VTVRRPRWDRIGYIALLVLVVLVLVACAAPGAPGASGASGVPVSPSPQPPLQPAQPGADPISFLAWIFTPIFQVMFIIMVAVYVFLENLGVPGAIGWAIVALTLVVRSLVIPLYRRQLTSQRRMQMLQPEIKEIQRRYKGDSMKARVAQQELMKERGISPLAGCLPLLLQMPLLFIMYSVIQHGLTNQDPTAMLSIFGNPIVHLSCSNVANGIVDATRPCIDTIIPIFGGIDVSKPSTFLDISIPGTSIVLGLSILAIISAGLQLVQSRMMLPSTKPEDDDPNTKIQRQTMLLLPLISVAYGGFLPAGLFIYWITATIFSIIQQYLIVGWGGMFPLFGRTPAFATGHAPRYPVSMPPPPDPSQRAAILTDAEKKTTAASTIRPRERGRQGRRGRRR
jgi:YidC/Oxa1 family membrane protein insertase